MPNTGYTFTSGETVTPGKLNQAVNDATLQPADIAAVVPQLTDATTVNAADELIIQQGGITKRATGAELAKGLNTINGTVNVKDFGAVGDGVANDGPAIRAAAASVAASGGGAVYLPPGHYKFTNYQSQSSFQITSASAGAMVSTPVNCGLVLESGVSLIGAGSRCVTIEFPQQDSGGICVAPFEYSNGMIKGFRLRGGSATVGSIHGIMLSMLRSDIAWTNKNILLEDLIIETVSAYGIGHQYGSPDNVVVKNVIVENTGADCIDWKVRQGTGLLGNDSSGVIIESVILKNAGLKGTPSSALLGFRGRGALSNIEAIGVTNDVRGIYLVPGQTPVAGSYMTTLTNFYVSSNATTNDLRGLEVSGNVPVAISNGYLKRCRVRDTAVTVDTFGNIDGPSFNNIIVDGCRGLIAFESQSNKASFFNCRAIADKQFFDAKRANLQAGQTSLAIELGITHAVTVLKNGTALSSPADYSAGANNIVLTSPALATDAFVVIQNNDRPFRIQGVGCSVIGGGSDKYYTTNSYFPSSAASDSCNMVGFYDEKYPTFTMIPNGAVQFRTVREDPSVGTDIWLLPGAGGIVRGFGPTTSTTDSPITGYITIKDINNVTRKVAIIS